LRPKIGPARLADSTRYLAAPPLLRRPDSGIHVELRLQQAAPATSARGSHLSLMHKNATVFA
jgi:hypothetical protein